MEHSLHTFRDYITFVYIILHRRVCNTHRHSRVPSHYLTIYSFHIWKMGPILVFREPLTVCDVVDLVLCTFAHVGVLGSGQKECTDCAGNLDIAEYI
jgi:hypothetical protein